MNEKTEPLTEEFAELATLGSGRSDLFAGGVCQGDSRSGGGGGWLKSPGGERENADPEGEEGETLGTLRQARPDPAVGHGPHIGQGAQQSEEGC